MCRRVWRYVDRARTGIAETVASRSINAHVGDAFYRRTRFAPRFLALISHAEEVVTMRWNLPGAAQVGIVVCGKHRPQHVVLQPADGAGARAQFSWGQIGDRAARVEATRVQCKRRVTSVVTGSIFTGCNVTSTFRPHILKMPYPASGAGSRKGVEVRVLSSAFFTPQGLGSNRPESFFFCV